MSNEDRWTKKDIRALCSQLSTAWLIVRDCHGTASARTVAAANWKMHMSDPTNRKNAILRGLRDLRELHARRYRENCETIGNQLVRFPKKDGEPDEIVTRFIQLAKDEDSDRAQYEALALRVHHLEASKLPREVLDYDPTAI